MSELNIWRQWIAANWHLLRHWPRGERGEITQTVIIVALFAAAAIAISAIIINKFTSKANSIPTG